MPHFWMFLLQALTLAGHDAMLIDGSAHPTEEKRIARYVRTDDIALVGIVAMTRGIAKAYRMADAKSAEGIEVLMGDARHADAAALGKADETWPRIVKDAARGAYKKLEAAGRLTRPKHWQEFIPFATAHTPLQMSIDEVHQEVRIGWADCYSPDAIEKVVDSLNPKSLGYHVNILCSAVESTFLKWVGSPGQKRFVIIDARFLS